MKKNTMFTRLFISLAVISFIFGCVIILMYLKPDGALPTSTTYFNSIHKQDLSVATPSVVATRPKAEASVNVLQLAQQRDDLYKNFGQISFAMIEGEKPDLRQISSMLKQHHQLVESGVISVYDATNYLEFLKKVFPELDSELDYYLNQLSYIEQKKPRA